MADLTEATEDGAAMSISCGNRNYWTLLHLRYDRHVFAGHGGNGSKCRSTGKDGEDKYIDVPCGTVVYNADTGEYVCDVKEHGQEVMLLKGGREVSETGTSVLLRIRLRVLLSLANRCAK